MPILVGISLGCPSGVVPALGRTWQEQRRFMIRHLSDLGMGRTHNMEEVIGQECDDLVRRCVLLCWKSTLTDCMTLSSFPVTQAQEYAGESCASEENLPGSGQQRHLEDDHRQKDQVLFRSLLSHMRYVDLSSVSELSPQPG